MNPGDDATSPTTGDPATPPGPGASVPTAEAVLGWIAAAGTAPWFPSAHARQTGIPRDSLDEPLNDLRQAGLVRVAEWVRGAGQGFVLTTGGAAAAIGGMPAPAPPADAPPAEPTRPASPEAGPPAMDLRPPVVTAVLLLANLVWFAAGVVLARQLDQAIEPYLSRRGDPALLHRLGAVSAPDLVRGQWWRLVTACFVHVGLIHLVANMVGLGTAGPLAEQWWGRWRFALVYALAGLGGSCLAMAIHPADETGRVVSLLAGASGAIWGVMGALVAWMLLYRDRLEPRVAAELTRRLGFALLLNVAISMMPGISWEGHLGGGVVGFLAAGLLDALRAGDRSRRVVAALLLAALPVACVGGLAAAMRWSDGWAPFRSRPAAHHELASPEVVGSLNELRPEAVRAVEKEAVLTLALPPARRSPAAVASIRGKVVHLREAAAGVANHLAARTVTGAAEDVRGREVAFADARLKSLGLLLALLDANAIPDVAAWRAWGDSRREADRRWADLAGR